MALSPQWLDELRARITLSSVIGRTTKLQRAGREWKACCPFHNERTPSFTVSDEKGFYHCFGCGAHGDAISWMVDQRGLAFMDAVKELAAEAGMEVPAPDPRAAELAEQRAGLHDVMAAAQGFFKNSLLSVDGAKAREYLGTRGLGRETIEEFGFGYAPDSRTAIKGALSQYEEPMLVEGGLRIAVDDREPYDRFRGRLMLPIQDARGRVIAFGGRILDTTKTDAPKYLNSPDTPLFDKGRTLYNLHRAGPVSRKSNRILVVEGYMDVIALANVGIEDAVAPLGTALTERQIELLWRLVPTPVLCFDGDAAGARAAMRAATRALPFLRPGHSLNFVSLPQGLDPDDLVRSEGADAMERLLASPQTLLDLLWQHERDLQPLQTPEDKAGLKARLITHTEAIQHPDIASLYRRELLDRFSAFAYPKKERRSWSPRQGSRPTDTRLRGEEAGRLRKLALTSTRDALARSVLAGLVRHPDTIERHGEALLSASEPGSDFARAVDKLIDAAEMLEPGGELPISGIEAFAPPPDNARFSFLMETSDPGAAREDLAEAVALLVERPAIEAALAAATKRFETTLDDDAFAEQQALLKRKLEFEKRLGQMASKRAAAAAPESDDGTASREPAETEEAD